MGQQSDDGSPPVIQPDGKTTYDEFQQRLRAIVDSFTHRQTTNPGALFDLPWALV